MADDDAPRDRAGTGGARGGAPQQPEGSRAFDVSELFPHGADAKFARDDVGALFAEPVVPPAKAATRPDPVDDLHLLAATALIDTPEGHLFESAEAEAHPYTHSFPAPVPARPEPRHAGPQYGIGRPQLIAMAVGLVVTALGAGWALASPAASTPVVAAASPSPTVDPERVAKVNTSIESLASAVKAAQASADSFTAPLAAMAGSSDESARVAAEAARQAYVAALAAVKVPEPAGKAVTNASLDRLERDVASAQASLTAASTGFRGAITTFRQSIPGFAAAAAAENPDAAEPFRTAVTDAGNAVAASDPFGPTPFAAMDAWRSALAALVADQARAVDEAQQYGSGGSGDTGTGGSDTPTAEPSTPPAPENPPPTDTNPPPAAPTP